MRPRLSIITAVHNQLAVNRIYAQSLQQHTRAPYELIVIDNASTDGSGDYFASVGARVIRNSSNWSYPHTQNQGIEVAQGEVLCFLNNDLVVSPGWDAGLLRAMQVHGLDVVTPCGIERVETEAATKRLRRRWHRIKYGLGLLGRSERVLRAMHRVMYGDWAAFCAARQARFGDAVIEGFVGNTVVMTRRALDLLGPWDPRFQAADFDIYLRSLQRSRTHGDIRPVHVALGTFIHHYIRLTLQAGYPPFVDAGGIIDPSEHWPKALFDRAMTINHIDYTPAA
ncbi:MAG: glycosyltransferase family 2 protein [Betaproteobacteria bacterium]|nr:glycosyltransferase family 2 protein [Betaproteobacteria bacterium]